MAAATIDDVVSSVPAGVVLPPPNVRTVVEKTAGYVARNGAAFETRMRTIEANNPLFSFFDPADAYHSYYDWRLSEIREGRGTDVSSGRTGASAAASLGEALGNGAAAIKASGRKPGPEPPAQFEFSAPVPTISAQDLDILKLTAKYAAGNGRGWITALSQRESRNFQFDFLKPQHSLNPYFLNLVDQYTSLLHNPSEPNPEQAKRREQRLKALRQNVADKYHILPRARKRAEWSKQQASERKQKEDEEEKERLKFLEIDWHDFVVVETITFSDADETAQLAPPTSLSDLQTASLEQRELMSVSVNMRIEEAMPTGGDDLDELIAQASAASMPVPPAEPKPGTVNPQKAQAIAAARGVGPMKIRNDYVPGTQQRRQEVQTATCPKCKQQIDLNEWDQHMRIELLDPEWRAQKASEAARLATSASNNAHASIDIANNLKRLSSQRGDVQEPLSAVSAVTASPLLPVAGPVDELQHQRSKMARPNAAGDISGGLPVNTPPGVQPDSHSMQNLTIEDQIKRLHQKYAHQ